MRVKIHAFGMPKSFGLAADGVDNSALRSSICDSAGRAGVSCAHFQCQAEQSRDLLNRCRC